MKFLFNSVLSFLIAFLFYTTLFSQDFQKCGTFSPENLSKIGQSCTRPSFNPASLNKWRDAGRYSIEFNASNLASGVYIYQLRVNDFVAAKKLMLLK